MEALNPWRMRAMARKYYDELRERATRLVVERENRELKRANEILRTASAFLAAAELDRKLK
jgi:transposase-like protein